MKKIRVMTVFGTRPEAIKMAPVVKALKANDQVETIVCVTAQHREMLDQVLELFAITPDHDLNVMKANQTVAEITSRMVKGVDEVIKADRPDILLVHGDTTTTFSAALAAFYNQVPVGHVEAGLRSHDMYSPFPEEMNRTLTGRIATLHFAPTEGNVENLIRECVQPEHIFKTGNTVIDALLKVVNPAYVFENELLNKIDYHSRKVVLLTAHRRENLGEPMENIFAACREVVEQNESVELIFPIHMNPKVREIAHRHLKGVDRVHLIEPLDYEPFANLMARAYLILTDSGGIQEEAPALGKPVLVLRTETERPEAVLAGTVKMTGVQKDAIVRDANLLIQNKEAYDLMANAVNPYGDGKTSERIVNAIVAHFNRK